MPVIDIGKWLKGIGLDKYDDLFREHDIDGEVLLTLTADDLKEIGVATVGHRRKLLNAIAGLAKAEEDTVPSAAPTSRFVPHVAERRHMTVLFCDLVGSTALSQRMDPEDMGDVLRSFHDLVSASVTRFDGYVAKLMGDGALVYFGFPQAHEDDPERAVRAALALVDALRGMQPVRGVPMEARVGISTGLVVVGERMGEGEAKERGVVGETPNLAARLQALALPGTVVVSDATQRLLRRTFLLEDLGRHALKGIEGPVQAWRVSRETGHVTRFEAISSGLRTPFVGREQEISLMADRWRDAVEGESQILLLSGEAGIGKSRILETFREELKGQPHKTLLFQCSPHRVNDAFFPIIGQVRRWARLATGEAPTESLAKLEAMVTCGDLDAGAVVPLLASLLSIPTDRLYPPLDMPASETKERLICTLVSLALRLSRDVPVLALLEDAHWIDPTSLDVFGRLIGSMGQARIMLVTTFRPEFSPSWFGQPRVTAHGLNNFGRRQVLAMIEGVSEGMALPPEVVEEIVGKTDGVPLFVEELTKSVIESGSSQPFDIPSTLHDSLMARLDRLGPVKEIAQVGASIGREFPYRLLEAVLPLKGRGLQDGLASLEKAGLVHGRGNPPESTYTFKHALVQNAAYATLLRGQRQRIHADIAAAMGDAATSGAPAIVAHHLTEAGLAGPAIRSWLAAAEAALDRSANREAASYIEKTVALLPQVPEDERSSLALALHLTHANALMFNKGIGAVETIASLQEANRLVKRGVGTHAQRMFLMHAFGTVEYIEARMGPALDIAWRFVDMAKKQSDTLFRYASEGQAGWILLLMGELEECLACFDRAEALHIAPGQSFTDHRFIWDPRISILCMKRWALLSMGRHVEAAQVAKDLEVLGSKFMRPYTVAFQKYLATVLPASMLGDLDTCERESANLVAFCRANHVDEFAHQGSLRHACAKALRDPSPANIAALPSALGSHWLSSHVSDSYNLSQHAEVLLRSGDVAGAEFTLGEAFAFVERSKERHWLSDLHCLAGRIALARQEPDIEGARASFHEAIRVANGQNYRMAELRATTRLAHLEAGGARSQEVVVSMETILASIDGGEDTRDVRKARSLLRRTGNGRVSAAIP